MTPSLLTRLNDDALKEYPVRMIEMYYEVDLNEPKRAIYLSGLKAGVEKYGRGIAEDAWKAGWWKCQKLGNFQGPSEGVAEYLASVFPEPDKKD